MQKITREEYEKIQDDYKGMDSEGIHRILKFDKELGTISVPVEIIN